MTAKVDSLIAISQLPASIATQNIDTTQELHTTLSPTGRIFHLGRDSSSFCSERLTPAAIRIHELVIGYPKRVLKVGDSWTDTVSTTVCRRNVALSQQAIRNYKILSFTTWNQQSAVAIRCTAFSILNTDLKQTQNHFGVSGSGESSALIYANQVTGVVLQSDIQSQLALTVITVRGLFPFSEILNTHIELH